MDYIRFKEWCAENGLTSDTDIARSIFVSPQTIRNWCRRNEVPEWVRLSMISIENNLSPMVLTVSSIKQWQQRNSLKTYEDTGAIFGRKRQTIHQWFRRGSFPNWLTLACPGYDFKANLKAEEQHSISDKVLGE